LQKCNSNFFAIGGKYAKKGTNRVKD